MYKLSSKLIFATTIAALLSACGGGSSGSGGVLGASSDALIGVNAETGANPQQVTLVQTTATATPQTGLDADFDGYNFVADSGFENGQAIENGNKVGLLTELDLAVQTDLRLFDGAYVDQSGAVAIYYGIVGDAPTDALPSSGTATWTGSAFAERVSSTGTTSLGTGTATVTASFPGSLSATLSGFSGDADSIAINGLAINGNRFTGTDIVTTRSGATVNIVGSNQIGQVDGILSGSQASNGQPDEVGALFTLTGGSATLIGGFVAD